MRESERERKTGENVCWCLEVVGGSFREGQKMSSEQFSILKC